MAQLNCRTILESRITKESIFKLNSTASSCDENSFFNTIATQLNSSNQLKSLLTERKCNYDIHQIINDKEEFDGLLIRKELILFAKYKNL